MNETNNISERLQLIINHYFNGNKSRFADKVGVLPQMVQQWLKKGISRSSMEKISESFPEVDKNWFYFGIGEMFGVSTEINNSPNSNNTGNFENSFNGDSALVNALRQQIEDYKAQLDKKDEQIQNLIDLMMKK